MASLKFKIWALYASAHSAIHDWYISCKGQAPEYEILQISHRIEKGLLIQNPRKMWGWDKARRLYELLGCTESVFAKETGKAVLSAYLEKKRSSVYNEDIEEYERFAKDTSFEIDMNNLGGTIVAKKPNFNDVALAGIKELFLSRHSAREFAPNEVDKSKLYEAINLALRCPSACNRQPFRVYVVDAEDKEKYIEKSKGYSGRKFLYVTGLIDAYTLDEINDWIVSPSIFAGYLTLSLHAMGIGSCVVRKDLACNTDYNKAVRKFCNIPVNEKIILELAIGNYAESYVAPVSNRKSFNDCVILCSSKW